MVSVTSGLTIGAARAVQRISERNLGVVDPALRCPPSSWPGEPPKAARVVPAISIPLAPPCHTERDGRDRPATTNPLQLLRKGPRQRFTVLTRAGKLGMIAQGKSKRGEI